MLFIDKLWRACSFQPWATALARISSVAFCWFKLASAEWVWLWYSLKCWGALLDENVMFVLKAPSKTLHWNCSLSPSTLPAACLIQIEVRTRDLGLRLLDRRLFCCAFWTWSTSLQPRHIHFLTPREIWTPLVCVPRPCAFSFAWWSSLSYVRDSLTGDFVQTLMQRWTLGMMDGSEVGSDECPRSLPVLPTCEEKYHPQWDYMQILKIWRRFLLYSMVFRQDS